MTNPLKAVCRLLGNQFSRTLLEQSEDLKSLARLGPHLPPTLPWGPFSMRPSAIEIILNEVIVNQRRSILELGSGVSTLALISLLQNRIEHYTSLDDNERWSQFVGSELSKLKIPREVYTMVPCRSTSVSLDARPYSWYDPISYEAATRNRRFDLLIVDGPKGSLGECARYPALPVLMPLLSSDFTVIIDDIHRREERLIACQWASRWNLDVQFHATRGRVAILRPRATESGAKHI